MEKSIKSNNRFDDIVLFRVHHVECLLNIIEIELVSRHFCRIDTALI